MTGLVGCPVIPCKAAVYRLASVPGELHNRTTVCAVLSPWTAAASQLFAFLTDADAHMELIDAGYYSFCISFACVG